MTDFHSIGRWPLAGDLPSAGTARALVREHLPGHGRLDDIELVVSELVANAVKYGQGGVEVAVATAPDALRVAVASVAGETEPQVRPATAHEPGGRGLAIVDTLADRWGWHREGDRIAVWAEFDHA